MPRASHPQGHFSEAKSLRCRKVLLECHGQVINKNISQRRNHSGAVRIFGSDSKVLMECHEQVISKNRGEITPVPLEGKFSSGRRFNEEHVEFLTLL
ncbi:hypothetical protein CDAR_483341 [Caerostris darwini]|uniref:Uncharacterized protein n=1 Tax=Caerostris darwini TaxID=1538125 RepID=A0AAV4SFV6_9ARAC|nr:hypothetical protein CDAR_483341 [Caerostris darwini]